MATRAYVHAYSYLTRNDSVASAWGHRTRHTHPDSAPSHQKITLWAVVGSVYLSLHPIARTPARGPAGSRVLWHGMAWHGMALSRAVSFGTHKRRCSTV